MQLTGRVAQRDTVVDGRPSLPGAWSSPSSPAPTATRRCSPDPARFDVARPNARDHLAFSGGRHFCLGAALARVEGEVGLRSLFERFPDLTPAPGERRRDTRVLRGWERLPVTTGV